VIGRGGGDTVGVLADEGGLLMDGWREEDVEDFVLRDSEGADEDARLSVPPASRKGGLAGGAVGVGESGAEAAAVVLQTALAASQVASAGRRPRRRQSINQWIDSAGTDVGETDEQGADEFVAVLAAARLQKQAAVVDQRVGRQLDAAAAKQPRDPAVAASIARALLQEPWCNFDAALDALEAALELFPADPDLVCTEAVALAMGGYEECGEALEEALQLQPTDLSCLTSYGVWLKSRRDFVGAEAAYKAALRLEPGDPVVMVNYGLLLEKWEGDWDSAHVWYKRALAVDPTNQRALLHRARIYEEETLDLNAAQDFYAQAGERGRDSWLAAEGLWRAGVIQWKSFNQTARAYGLLTRAASTCPSHPQALRALAALEAQHGDVEDAVGLYQRAAHALPSDADTLGEFADLCQSTGRIDLSEETYLQALALRPADVDALRGYAHLLKRHRGQAAMAAQLFESSKELEDAHRQRESLEQESISLMLNDNSTIDVSLVEVPPLSPAVSTRPYTHWLVCKSHVCARVLARSRLPIARLHCVNQRSSMH